MNRTNTENYQKEKTLGLIRSHDKTQHLTSFDRLKLSPSLDKTKFDSFDSFVSSSEEDCSILSERIQLGAAVLLCDLIKLNSILFQYFYI